MKLPLSAIGRAGRRAPMLVGALAGLAAVTGATVARAEGPSQADQALATTLFREGRRLMETGSIAQACDKFAESQRLAPGGGTLLNLAACHEKEGRTASAWTEFTGALAQARRDGRHDRARVAQARLAAIEPRLSTLTIEVEAPAAELLVTLDQTPVRSPGWGVAVPVDPGEHVVEATAPHKKPWQARVVIAPGHDVKTAHVPPLADDAAGPPPTPAPAPPTPIGAAAIAPPPQILPPPVAEGSRPTPSTSPPARSLALRDGVTVAAALVGVGGAVVGSIFGLRALSEHADSNAACPNERCTKAGAALNDRAGSAADVSTIGFAVGGAGLGIAALLLLTRPSSEPSGPSAAVVPGGAFVTWRGAF
jgi:hypothetical protein